MKEMWRNIDGFLGYQISDQGQVGSFWKRKHRPTGYGCDWILSDDRYIIKQSDDGNGYMKVMLTDHVTGKRRCRKVHKLVADAFLGPHKPGDTVDHIRSGPEGKLDNSVGNLQWMPRGDNVRKAYRDGRHRSRILQSMRDIVAIDLWTGDEIYFSSIKEASEELRLDRTSISHVLRGDTNRTSHYKFEYAGREERILYGNDEHKFDTWLRYGLR